MAIDLPFKHTPQAQFVIPSGLDIHQGCPPFVAILSGSTVEDIQSAWEQLNDMMGWKEGAVHGD